MERLESKEIRFCEDGERWTGEVRLKQNECNKRFYLRKIKIEAFDGGRTVQDSYKIMKSIGNFFQTATMELQNLNHEKEPNQ